MMLKCGKDFDATSDEDQLLDLVEDLKGDLQEKTEQADMLNEQLSAALAALSVKEATLDSFKLWQVAAVAASVFSTAQETAVSEVMVSLKRQIVEVEVLERQRLVDGQELLPPASSVFEVVERHDSATQELLFSSSLLDDVIVEHVEERTHTYANVGTHREHVYAVPGAISSPDHENAEHVRVLREAVYEPAVLQLDKPTGVSVAVGRAALYEVVQPLPSQVDTPGMQRLVDGQELGLPHGTKDRWETPRDSIKLCQELGSGEFGVVYEGTWNGTKQVAVKTIKSGTMAGKDFVAEATIMMKLQHPYIIQLYAVCTDGEPNFIITELMLHGSLLDFLHDKGQALKLPQLVDMAAQVAAGMGYLEIHDYIHRDVAARNILVGKNNVCKVGDFGLARFLMHNAEYFVDKTATRFPIRWTAPESLRPPCTFSIKSDVWSYGILLTELITHGRTPYPGMTNAEVRQMVTEGHLRMSQPTGCSDAMHRIMLRCWTIYPKDRPTFAALQTQLRLHMSKFAPVT